MDVHVSDVSRHHSESDEEVLDASSSPLPSSTAPLTAASASSRSGKPRIDGRLARSQRTIEHIVQALLEILEHDGDLRPTAHQVARRAGVSRRALYLHFDSLEALFATAAQRRLAEVCAAWEVPDLDSPLEQRIEWFATRWAALCEAMLPLRKAAAVYEPFSVQVASTIDRGRRWARSAAELVFWPELLAVPEEDRMPYRSALHHITSWSAWDDLRHQGAEVTCARKTLQLLLVELFAR